jgi:hypothetical protein
MSDSPICDGPSLMVIVEWRWNLVIDAFLLVLIFMGLCLRNVTAEENWVQTLNFRFLVRLQN